MITIPFTKEQADTLKAAPVTHSGFDSDYGTHLYCKIVVLDDGRKIWQEVRVTEKLHMGAKKNGNMDQLKESIEKQIDYMIDEKVGKDIPFLSPL